MNVLLLVASFVLGLALAGVLYQGIGARRDRKRFTSEGRWVDIGNRCRLYLRELNSREEGSARPEPPTVIFESGIGASSLNWHRLQRDVCHFAATASYDRAGLGWSDPCATPRTPVHVAAELHTLLQCAQIKPPYVLVGHSFGGLAMR